MVQHVGLAVTRDEDVREAIVGEMVFLVTDRDLQGAHQALGEIYLKMRKFEEAEAAFSREIEIHPYNYGAKCEWASLLTQNERVDEVVLQLSEAVKKNPSVGCLPYLLGKALIRKGQFDEAIKCLQEAVAVDPENESVYLFLGQAYGKVGQKEKSEAAFQRSLSLREKKAQQVKSNLGAAALLFDESKPSE